MPPVANKDVSLLLFDMKSSNKDELLEGLIKLVTQKMVSTNDFCHLLLVNCLQTSNAKNVSNVCVSYIDILDPKKVFYFISNAQKSEDDTDFLEVLSLAIHYTKVAEGIGGIVNYQIIYFTTLENHTRITDDAETEEIIKKFNDYGYHLYIIGPNVTLAMTINNCEDIPKAMRRIVIDDCNVTLCTAKKIIQQTEGGVLCNLKIGVNIALYFREHQGSQPWLVPISIGNNLHIPTKTFTIFNRKSKLKLTNKKFNFLATTYILEEDERIEIPSEELIKGVICHDRFVRIEDEDIFKFQTERCFNIVGFTKKKYVPEAYVKGDSTSHVLPGSILPYDGNYQLFFTLVKVLSKNNKCAIVERIHSKNNIHKYFVLEPVLDVNGPHFVMTNLPYADDFSEKFTLSEVSKESLHDEEEDDFDRFCRSIDIQDDLCTIEVPLGPMMMTESLTNNLVKEVARKLCDKDFKFTSTESDEMSGICKNKYWDVLKKSWPVENQNNTNDFYHTSIGNNHNVLFCTDN